MKSLFGALLNRASVLWKQSSLPPSQCQFSVQISVGRCNLWAPLGGPGRMFSTAAVSGSGWNMCWMMSKQLVRAGPEDLGVDAAPTCCRPHLLLPQLAPYLHSGQRGCGRGIGWGQGPGQTGLGTISGHLPTCRLHESQFLCFCGQRWPLQTLLTLSAAAPPSTPCRPFSFLDPS